MIAFLDANFGGQGITNLLTFGLIVVTAFYVLLTHKISHSTRLTLLQLQAQHELLVRPLISISIEMRQHVVVCLRIKNTGNSIAREVKLSVDKDFYQFAEYQEEKNIRNFLSFQEPIPSMAPNEQLFILLSQGFNIGTIKNGIELTPATFSVSVSYKFGVKIFEDTHQIDLRHFFRSSPDIDDGVRELEKLRKAVEKLSSAS